MARLALSTLSLLLAAAPAAAQPAPCPPSGTLLESPRAGATEVQAKALNDRGDLVGFANGRDGTFRAILWRGGTAPRALNLGVLPGYVSSEAYGINNDRVVFGLLYDRRERAFPFRWEDGRMKVLKGPRGRLREALVPDRNTVNARGQIAATLVTPSGLRAVRWTRKGKPTLLRPLPGHKWTHAWSISDRGVVSGWSRRLPSEDGENNPVIWSPSGEVVALKTVPGRADGAAEATNRAGLTVGYLGNLGDSTDLESDQVAIWAAPTAEPLLLGPATPLAYAELVDVNDSGQAAGMIGTFTATGFVHAQPVVWQPGATELRPLSIPTLPRAHRVVVTGLNDINSRGAIAGDVYGLAAASYPQLQRVYPVVWSCPFGG